MTDTREPAPALKRSLGVVLLTFQGTGMILGAGIYSIVGPAAGLAGEALWMPFALAAVIAALTGLSYAGLARRFPGAGAEYHYFRSAFTRHRRLASALGAAVALGGITSAAAVAVAFAGYLGHFVDLPAWLVSMGLVALFTGVNILGIRESTWVNVALTVVEAAGLIVLVVIASRSPGFGDAFAAAPGPGLLPATALVMFAYFGFESIATLSQEAKHPARDVPRAILFSLAISTLLYVAVAISAVALLPAADLAASSRPLADALAGTRWGASGLVIAALFSTANTVLIALVAASRLLFGIAAGGDMPAPLARVLPGRRTPVIAALVVGALVMALVPVGRVDLLAGAAALATLAGFAGMNAALVLVRWRERSRSRLAARLGAVALPVLGLLTATGAATQLSGDAWLAGAAMLLLIAPVLTRPRPPEAVTGRTPAGFPQETGPG